jgi:hypothetical protein
MSTETLKQYRETTFQDNYVPQVQIVTKGEDGITRVAKSNPATGALVVDTELDVQATVVSDAGVDLLKTAIVGQRNNQLEIEFRSAPSATLITNTFATGGAVAYSNGHAIYSTSTAASASAKGVSVAKTKYRPLHELYSAFTAAFTVPTSANSYQRIGLYDAADGFFLGYSGLTFGITKRVGSVDTFIARTAFNVDLLDGSAGSKFTRDEAPEALDLTKSNLFRIRFAWLGSANILFEVFSPDGNWVVFHNIKQPNSDVNPSIANPDLPMTLEVAKASADATDLKMYTACWAAGTTSDLAPVTATLTDNTLATLSRSVITGVTTGGGGGYVNVKVNPSGALTAEVDGTVSVDNFPATQNVLPLMASGGNLSVTTAATGTNFTAFASQACKQLTISNQSGVTIEVRQGGAGVAFRIPTAAFYTFFGITNANQLDIRRSDTSNTQVTITARWEN